MAQKKKDEELAGFKSLEQIMASEAANAPKVNTAPPAPAPLSLPQKAANFFINAAKDISDGIKSTSKATITPMELPKSIEEYRKQLNNSVAPVPTPRKSNAATITPVQNPSQNIVDYTKALKGTTAPTTLVQSPAAQARATQLEQYKQSLVGNPVNSQRGGTQPVAKPKQASWGTIADDSLAKGIVQTEGDAFNVFRTLVKLVGNDKANKFMDDYYNDIYQKQINQYDANIGKTTGVKDFVRSGLEAVPQTVISGGIGAMLAPITAPAEGAMVGLKAASTLLPKAESVVRMLPFGFTAGGGHAREAELQGANPVQQTAMMIAGGILESVTEAPVMTSWLDLAGNKFVKEGAKNIVERYGKQGLEYLKNGAKEAAQEAIVEPMMGVASKSIYQPDKQWVGKNGVVDAQAMKDAGVGGIAMSVVMGAMGLPINMMSHRMATKVVESGKTATTAQTEAINEQLKKDVSYLEEKTGQDLHTVDQSADVAQGVKHGDVVTAKLDNGTTAENLKVLDFADDGRIITENADGALAYVQPTQLISKAVQQASPAQVQEPETAQAGVVGPEQAKVAQEAPTGAAEASANKMQATQAVNNNVQAGGNNVQAAGEFESMSDAELMKAREEAGKLINAYSQSEMTPENQRKIVAVAESHDKINAILENRAQQAAQTVSNDELKNNKEAAAPTVIKTPKGNVEIPDDVTTMSDMDIQSTMSKLSEQANSMVGNGLSADKLPELQVLANQVAKLDEERNRRAMSPTNKSQDAPAVAESRGEEVTFTDNNGILNGGVVKHTAKDGSKVVQVDGQKSYVVEPVKGKVDEYKVVESKLGKDEPSMDERKDNPEIVENAKVKAYQFKHPELRPYIQQEAAVLLGEMERTTKGERQATKSESEKDGLKISGIKRFTSSEIAYMLDVMKMKYDEIKPCLERIVKDDGAENTKNAKKVEIMLDERLVSGYQQFDSPDIEVPPNQDYIALRAKIEGKSIADVEKAAKEVTAIEKAMAANDAANRPTPEVMKKRHKLLKSNMKTSEDLKREMDDLYNEMDSEKKAPENKPEAKPEKTHADMTQAERDAKLKELKKKSLKDHTREEVIFRYEEIVRKWNEDKELQTMYPEQFKEIKAKLEALKAGEKFTVTDKTEELMADIAYIGGQIPTINKNSKDELINPDGGLSYEKAKKVAKDFKNMLDDNKPLTAESFDEGDFVRDTKGREGTVSEISGYGQIRVNYPNDTGGNEYKPGELEIVKKFEKKPPKQGPRAEQNFKEWFDGSVVVDEKGKPLVFYHGSTDDFDIFDENMIKAGETDAWFNGFWFTDREDQASPSFRNAKYIKSYYLSLRNPAPHDTINKLYWEIRNDTYENHNKNAIRPEARSFMDEVRFRLQEMGYDGVIQSDIPIVDWTAFDKTGETDYTTVRGTHYRLKESEGYIDIYRVEDDGEGGDFEEYITDSENKEDLIDLMGTRIYVVFKNDQIRDSKKVDEELSKSEKKQLDEDLAPKNETAVVKTKPSFEMTKKEYNKTNNVNESEDVNYHGTTVDKANNIIENDFEDFGSGANVTQDYETAKEYADGIERDDNEPATVIKVRLKNGAKPIGEGIDEDSFDVNDVVVDHEEVVKKAISEGKKVPANVLSEYPQLRAKKKPAKLLENPFQEETINPFEDEAGSDIQDMRRVTFMLRLLNKNDAVEFEHADGRRLTFAPSTKDGKYQITEYDANGEPLSDAQHESKTDAATDIISRGYGAKITQTVPMDEKESKPKRDKPEMQEIPEDHIYSADDLIALNEGMLGEGAPVEYDNIGYNKADFDFCLNLNNQVRQGKSLSYKQLAALAKKLTKYGNTQLGIEPKILAANEMHYRKLAEDMEKRIQEDSLSHNGEDLPELEGSFKQVKWANTIRSKMLEQMEEHLNSHKDDADYMDKFQIYNDFKAQRSAKWLIDNRVDTGSSILEGRISLPIKQEIKEGEANESVNEKNPGEKKQSKPGGHFTGLDSRLSIELSESGKKDENGLYTTRGGKLKDGANILSEKISKTLRKHQIEGVNLAVSAMDAYGGFILSDGTGAGKTRQEIATAQHYLDKGHTVLIVTTNATNISKSFKSEAVAMGLNLHPINKGAFNPKAINITTYSSLNHIEKATFDYIIFDESHNLKNFYDSPAPAKARRGVALAGRAKGVMFASATPLDKAMHVKYLGKILFGKRSFSGILSQLGYEYKENNFGGRYERVIDLEEAADRLTGFFDELAGLGLIIKREVPMDNVEVSYKNVHLTGKVHEILDKIFNFHAEKYGLSKDGNIKGVGKALMLMAQRRFQESYKIEAALEMARKELAEGRQVVVFATRVNDTEFEENDADAEMVYDEKTQTMVPAKIINTAEGTLTKLVMEFEREFGRGSVAKIFGAGNVDKDVDAFQSGKAKIAVVTPQKGGAGLSLDDNVGDAPRTMIVITPPFSAVDNVQMAGRVNRLNTKSSSRVIYLFANTEVDDWNKSIITEKMKTLNAAVKGDIDKLDTDNISETTTHVDSKKSNEVPDAFKGNDTRGHQGIVAPGTIVIGMGNKAGKRHKFSDATVEKRFSTANGLGKEGLIDRAKAALQHFRQAATRTFIHMDEKNPENAKFVQEMVHYNKIHGLACDEVIRSLEDITSSLNSTRYDTFRKIIILKDVMEDSEFGILGLTLPFGFKDMESVKRELDILETQYMDGLVKQALDKREAYWESMRVGYMTAMQKMGFDVSKKFGRTDYYRHQVLEKMKESSLGLGEGGSGKNKLPKNRGFLKKRNNDVGMDYNTNYFEAEYEVMAQMIRDKQVAEMDRRIIDGYSITDKLKEEAKKQTDDIPEYKQLKKDRADKNKVIKALVDNGAPASAVAFVRDEVARINTKMTELRIDWHTLIPEGYTVHQYIEGNTYYTATTLAQRAYEEVIASIPSTAEISAADLREILAVGQKHPEYVFTNEIKATIDDRDAALKRNKAAAWIKKVLNYWKRWVLGLNPHSFFRYNIRNMMGDLDKVFAADPRIVKYLARSSREIFTAMKFGKFSPGMMEFYKRGEFSALTFPQEIGETTDIQKFKKFQDKKTQSVVSKINPLKIPMGAFNKWKDFSESATNYREMLLRYSAYLYAQEHLNKGKVIYWASKRAQIDGLDNNTDKAVKLAKDLLGAYDEVTVVGKTMRDYWIPFYSWTEVNFKGYMRLIKNAGSPEVAVKRLEAKGKHVSGQRLKVTQAIGVAGSVAGRVPMLAVKAAAFSVICAIWNSTVVPDDDDKLSEDIKKTVHITLGHDADGNIIYFNRLGSVGDFLEWFGLSGISSDMEDLKSGRKTKDEQITDMWHRPVNKFVQGINPFAKAAVELWSKKKLYPDVFKPVSIRDKTAYMGQTIGLPMEINKLAEIPQEKITIKGLMEGTLSYKYNPETTSYYNTLELKSKFEQQVLGKSPSYIASEDPKSLSIYYYKSALKYGDEELAAKYLQEYKDNGGTKKGYDRSLDMMNPIYGLSNKEKAQFRKWLTTEEIGEVDNALDYYHTILNSTK